MEQTIIEIRDKLIAIKTLWNLGDQQNIVRAKQKLTGLITDLEKYQ